MSVVAPLSSPAIGFLAILIISLHFYDDSHTGLVIEARSVVDFTAADARSWPSTSWCLLAMAPRGMLFAGFLSWSRRISRMLSPEKYRRHNARQNSPRPHLER